ncbi:helix-turn-helix transcriptional regulator [Clostridium beijerinckii]|uniref:helix-turn-helix domain-containing protein n=1 Tax=Clostridium beijerinckii TaxID=1520 RepID=UPI0022276AA8|nr:helix-turn-helix transcriptional regulator [Clostridium beijerinckii]UYZ34984.1 helix-turn-helix transcriptional regulator [Clostridium beijerinckii]
MLKLDIRKLLLLQAKACLNTNELAEKATIPRTTITNIVHGKRNATPKTIGLLAKALNVEVSELIFNEE